MQAAEWLSAIDDAFSKLEALSTEASTCLTERIRALAHHANKEVSITENLLRHGYSGQAAAFQFLASRLKDDLDYIASLWMAMRTGQSGILAPLSINRTRECRQIIKAVYCEIQGQELPKQVRVLKQKFAKAIGMSDQTIRNRVDSGEWGWIRDHRGNKRARYWDVEADRWDEISQRHKPKF